MKILTKAEHEKDIMSLGEVKEIIKSIEAINLECDDKTLDTLKLGTNVQSALENLLNYIYTLDTKATLLANSIKNYEGGLGITVTDNTISHSNNLKADGSVGSGEAQEPDFGERATLGWFKYDLQGHVTFTGTGNILIPSADTAITSTSVRPISSKAVYDNLIASKIRVTERSIGSEGSTVTIKDNVKTSLENLQNHIFHLYTNSDSMGKALTDLTGIIDKINVSVGATNVPVYFKDGVPTVCKYTLGSICTKSTTDYLSSTGGTVTGLITASGDVQVPSSKSTVGNSVPLGGSITGLTALTGLSSYRSLIGSVSVSSTWYDVISVRHRNGHNDGGNYGMYIYSTTTSTGDLIWNKQTASSTWQGARTILDSSNYKTYCTPANIGASASGHSHSVATTSANGFMSSTDKSKLDGIATGANKTVVDSSFSTTSTNPVQNKVVKNKIDAMDNVISTLSNSLQGAYDKFSEYLPLTGGTLSDDAVIKAVYSIDKRYTTYGHNIKMYAPNAGWSSGISYYSYSGTSLGTIGGYGTAEALTYFFIGKSYSDYYFKLTTAGNATFKGSVTATSFVGNASSATKLATARTINGVSFNGTADITIPRSTKRIHRAYGTVGSNGYMKFCTIKAINTYANHAVKFVIAQRGRPPYELFVELTSVGSTNCEINVFRYTSNADTGASVYYVKTGTGTFDLYVQKVEPYDCLYVLDVVKADDDSGASYTITWTDTHATTVPTGYVKATSSVQSHSHGNYLATTIPTTQPLLFEKDDTSSITSATITGLFTNYKLILIEVYGSKDGRRSYIVPLLILKSKGSMCFSSSVKFNVRYTDDNTIGWFEYMASGSENFTSVKIYAIY